MPDCKIHHNQLLVNNTPRYVCGAEIQYFRLRRSEWKDRLQTARNRGVNTITSYMPWYWHEPEEGKCDLTGRNREACDLRAFLQLVAELDLMMVARPGPFVNSELRCGGIPEWLFRDYPETMSCRADGGKALGRPNPAEGEPAYRDRVREWYRQVVPLIAEFDIHRGGPVILFQPDNELSSAWSYGLLNSLYDPTILGHYWPEWLRATYDDLDVLNRRYDGRYAEFTEVEAPRAFPANAFDRSRCLDWMNFKRDFFSEWGATLAKWAMEDGIQVPITFNEPVAGFYGHGDHPGFGSVMMKHGIRGTSTCHTYSDRIMDLDGIVNPAIGMELVKSSPWGGPPMSVEINANWYIPRLSRSEVNWESVLRLGLGHGLMGSVIYPYAAGFAPFRDTIDGPLYWEPVCLDVEGNPTPSCNHVERFFSFIQAWEQEITDAQCVSELTIAFAPGQRLVDFLGFPSASDEFRATATAGGETFDAEPALARGEGTSGHDWLDGYEAVSKQTIAAESGVWKKTKEAVLLMQSMNVAYDMLELTNPNREPGKGWIMIASTGCMEIEATSYLLEHLDAGGGCLFCPTLPTMDLEGNPDLRLADRLGVRVTDKIRPAGGCEIDYGSRVVAFGDGDKMGIDGWLFAHEFPAGSTVLATHSSQALAARLPGAAGKAVVVGFDPVFTSVGTQTFWRMILQDSMEIEPVISTSGAAHHVLLRQGKAATIATVMNVTGSSAPGTVTIRNPAAGIEELSLELDLGYHEARCLLIKVELGAGRMIHTTSELTPLNEERSVLQLRGHAGTRGEIAFAQPVTVDLNGTEVRSQETGDVHLIRYVHDREPMVMKLGSVAKVGGGR